MNTANNDTASQIEPLSWNEYSEAVNELSTQIKDSNFEPDIILAIARGGLFLAGSIGYAIKVKNISVINVELYTGINEKLEVPMMLPPLLNKLELKNMKVLVCDDLTDSGQTMATVNEYLKDVVAVSQSAVLYEKSKSITKCDFVWRRTDKWVDFPWSSLE